MPLQMWQRPLHQSDSQNATVVPSGTGRTQHAAQQEGRAALWSKRGEVGHLDERGQGHYGNSSNADHGTSVEILTFWLVQGILRPIR